VGYNISNWNSTAHYLKLHGARNIIHVFLRAYTEGLVGYASHTVMTHKRNQWPQTSPVFSAQKLYAVCIFKHYKHATDF